MQVMKIEEAKKREEYLAAIRPMSEKRFQHFATEQEKQAHIEGVRQDQESGVVPF